ncbi:UNVERIFIED_CONTAM: DUF21 domain-containing protein [Sesamum angustifolium]|uniref:DUF21 domain-containing protein n=1 Tax=Sesamum angustifolium TaxID=2727405 RepID=A0AAW2IP48_9LAMI
MSGLTLGLMSLGLVDLEILQRSGTPTEKKQAAAILPVVQKQHQLLVTLLLCNAASMELKNFTVHILLTIDSFSYDSVIRLSLKQYAPDMDLRYLRHLLFVGHLSFRIAVQCSPKILDVFWDIMRRCLDELTAEGSCFYSQPGVEHFEFDISSFGENWEKISYFSLIYKAEAQNCSLLPPNFQTAEEAMTPIESTFSLDVNSKLDWEAMGKILARGHSRVPVYSGNPKNIIGLLLVKSLLTVRAETETPVSAVSIRRIPRCGEAKRAKTKPPSIIEKMKRRSTNGKSDLTMPLLSKKEEKPESFAVDIEKVSRPPSKTNLIYSDAVTNGPTPASDDSEMEEIVDETDEFVDVHKRIRVAAAAAASSVARAPSVRRLTGQKGAISENYAVFLYDLDSTSALLYPKSLPAKFMNSKFFHRFFLNPHSGRPNKQGQPPRKPGEDDSTSARLQSNVGESLPGNKR